MSKHSFKVLKSYIEHYKTVSNIDWCVLEVRLETFFKEKPAYSLKVLKSYIERCKTVSNIDWCVLEVRLKTFLMEKTVPFPAI